MGIFSKKGDSNPVVADQGPSTDLAVGVSPTYESRRKVNNTARGLLFGGVALMGTGLSLNAAFADNTAEEAQPSPQPAEKTHVVEIETETETVTATPDKDAAAPGTESETSEPTEEMHAGQQGELPPAGTVGPVDETKAPTYGRHASLVSGDSYQVVDGDTLANIAARAGVDIWQLAKANNIANVDLIYAGSMLRIP